MLANEDKASHCIYNTVFGVKELGQCLPSIDELSNSNNSWTMAPLKTSATAYVIDGSWTIMVMEGCCPKLSSLGNSSPKQQILSCSIEDTM